jgi:MoxR-like ATPase
MEQLKSRLAALIESLCQGLIERDLAVRLALLAALSAEHTLLIGPPGTAKSELARRLHRAFRDAAYFERLLTRFTVPEELFGPLSIAALEQDRYERQTAGFLPTASIAFIDEVFKANSAILNALLTLLNEREFDNGARRVAAPLISVIGASNEVPDDEVTAAFYDRFLVRIALDPVSESGFAALLQLPRRADFDLPPALALGREELVAIGRLADDVALPAEVAEMLGELRAHLGTQGTYVSDRRWRKILRLLQTAAATDGRDAVSIWDLWLTQFCAPAQPRQRETVECWFEERLGTLEALDPPRFKRVVEAFESQLELERNADDLNYDDAGRLAFGDGSQADFDDRLVADGKNAAQAPRMSFMRRRRYGSTHIAARVAQVEQAIEHADAYVAALDVRLAELDQVGVHYLWIDSEFCNRAGATLRHSRSNVAALRERAIAAREGFSALPRLGGEAGEVPAPMAVA